MIEILITGVASTLVTLYIGAKVHALLTEQTVRIHVLETELKAARDEASMMRDRAYKADEATRQSHSEYDRLRKDFDRVNEENANLRKLNEKPPVKATKAKGGRRR
jgi:hypothetical protein